MKKFIALILFSLLTANLFAGDLVLKNGHVRISVSDKGLVTELIDLQTGINFNRPNFDSRFCVITMANGKTSGSVSLTAERLKTNQKDTAQNSGAPVNSGQATSSAKEIWTVGFQNAASARLEVEVFENYFTFKVLDIRTPDKDQFYKMEFARIFTTIDYAQDNTSLGVSPMILNIRTNILDYPGYSTRIGGVCYQSIGYKDAQFALIADHPSRLRVTMKQIAHQLLTEAKKNPDLKKNLPVLSQAGGPFADEIAKSHGSYIITSQSITADQVDQWSDHLKQFGVDQVDFHQGGAFQQADFTFNPTAYPNGISDFRKMSDAFRKKGIVTGLHTYAMFLPYKTSKFVSPVPRHDLADIQTFTLATDLAENDTELPILESCDHVDTVTGYLVWNSVYLRLDNEIIKFNQVGPKGSKKFIQCERGVLGTRKSAHKKGEIVHHLGFYFNNYFVPAAGSDLFYQIARDTAKAYDDGGFGMIYLDALDGNWRAVQDKQLVWYYDALFVREILWNIKTEAPLLEYSTMHESLWGGRSRMGAWDAPQKGYVAFFNSHFESNFKSASMRMLPGQIGWLALCPPNRSDFCDNFQYQTIHRENIEYLGTKALAYDFGFSYIDIPITGIRTGGLENGHLLQSFDKLRRPRSLDPRILKQLREPNKFFTLGKDQKGKDAFFPAQYPSFKLNAINSTVQLENPYPSQNGSFRIENLTTVEKYDSPKGRDLVALDENQPVEKTLVKKFDPPVDLRTTPGLGMFIYGDGKGQIVNVRVSSPDYRFSGVNDHYIKIDFTGWKYVQWVEAENGAYPEIKWPGRIPNVYLLYRNPVYYDTIDRVEIMIAGDSSGLKFRTLKALPLQKADMTDPILVFGGKELKFEGKIPAGCYVEYSAGSTAEIHKATGDVIGALKVSGQSGSLITGKNPIQFRFQSNATNLPSARLTFKIQDAQPIK